MQNLLIISLAANAILLVGLIAYLVRSRKLEDLLAEARGKDKPLTLVWANYKVLPEEESHLGERWLEKKIHKSLASKLGYMMLRRFPSKTVWNKGNQVIYSVTFLVSPNKREDGKEE